jgi:alanine dehydrogenase
MLVGVPKEIKTDEFRVGLLPHCVRELVNRGHEVLVEKDCALGIGFSDEIYREAGASIADTAQDVFDRAEMIIKVKEPQISECRMMREGQILFTYLHLAPDREQALALQASGCTAIAYETVTDANGRLPLLSPMSEVAGRLSIQQGAYHLVKHKGGSGILLGGVPGVSPAKVVIIGAGIVGSNAMRMALGMEAEVVVLDRSIDRIRELDMTFGRSVKFIYSSQAALEEHVTNADLVVGAVLIPGGSAPKLIDKPLLASMRKGSVLVDVSIDQGGCFETSKPTTHSEPTYLVDGIVHYCVANMPGAVPRTSSFALNNATLHYILSLADFGLAKAFQQDKHLQNGLNIHRGMVTHDAVAKELGLDYVPAQQAIDQA